VPGPAGRTATKSPKFNDGIPVGSNLRDNPRLSNWKYADFPSLRPGTAMLGSLAVFWDIG
jgi:hypothetical protein